MSLADILAETRPRRGGVKCSTCTWRDALNDEDRATFDQAIAQIHNTGSGASRLHAACAQMGMEVSLNTFREHVRSRH